MDVFRPVDGDKVLPDRVMQGQPWRNISFGKSAPIKEYQDKGLYLEVSIKPEITKYQKAVPDAEVINHINKTVTIKWVVEELPQDKQDEIDEQEVKEDEKKNGTLANVTIAQGEAWIDNTVVNLETAKLALKKLFRYIKART